LDDVKETRGYWKFIKKALDCILWRISFAKVYGPVIRQTSE